MDEIVVLWNTVSTTATVTMARETAILQSKDGAGEDVEGRSSEGIHSQHTGFKEL